MDDDYDRAGKMILGILGLLVLAALVGWWVWSDYTANQKECPEGSQMVVVLDYNGFPVKP